MRLLLPILIVAGLAAPAWAQEEDTPAPAAATWKHTISGGLQINPLGTALRYDLSRTLPAGFRAGVYDNFQVYSNEVGFQVGWQTEPPILEAHVDVGGEPGFFIHADPGGGDAMSGDGLAGAGDRTLGWRGIVRAQINFNLQINRVWLYSRTTGLLRFRDFLEKDTFQGIRIRHERSIEQATAVMFRFAGDPPGGPAGTFWAYGEYTVGGIDGFGTRPNRVSAGVVTERWPWRSTSLNIDFFFSFAPEPIDGPGIIFAYYFRF